MSTRMQVEFEAELRARIAELSRDGERQNILVTLAEVLQQELLVHPSHRQGQEVKYADPLENIMRAIISVLDENGRGSDGLQGDYISNKLRFGIRRLAYMLEEDSPRFTKREAEHDVRLVEL